MKKLSKSLLSSTVAAQRKTNNMTQQQLADATGINRALISRLEKQDFIALNCEFSWFTINHNNFSPNMIHN